MDPETDVIDRMSATFRLNTQISKNIHDQGNFLSYESYAYDSYDMIHSGDSSLCWAYSSASMIRRSLIDFWQKHKDDADLNLTPGAKSYIRCWLEDNEFHSILRSEIVMNPIPKRIKRGRTRAERARHEKYYIKEASERVSCPCI